MFLEYMATKILNSSSLGLENDCKEIHDSWDRLNHLVQALASRSQLQRRQIRETYMVMYGDDLISHLQKKNHMTSQKNEASEVSPKTCAALSLWMLDPQERDAVVAWTALEQDYTNFEALVEIFVGRKSSNFLLIKQAYYSRFRRHLDQDISKIEPAHPYQKILVALAASHNAHHADISQHIAKRDAKRLYETGEGRSGANIEEAVVLEIFSKRSIPQLKLTLSSYKRIYGHDYTKSLMKESSGEFEGAVKMVVKCMYNPPKYYAKALYTSIKGTTKDKDALVRGMVSRAEVDMEEINKVFKKKYGMELRDFICENIPSGDFRDFLVALATKTTAAAAMPS